MFNVNKKRNMFNEIDESKIFYNPGDLCQVRHNVPNKPTMWVVEKSTRSLYNKDTNEKENVFLGIKCRWFNTNGDIQEALFSTKDLIKL